MIRTIRLSVLLMAFSVTTALAEKNVSIDPKIASLTSPGTAQTFDAALAEPMAAVKGEWKVVDGVLVGKELEADKHAAVLNFQKKNRNSVVRFSFKVDGTTTGFNFSLNHAKGHLFRVVVTPTAMTICRSGN